MNKLLDLADDLGGHFTGTEHHYKHFLGLTRYTDGVRELAEKHGCHWLLDAIASHQRGIVRRIPFQIWRATVKNHVGYMYMTEDTDTPELVKQVFKFTDLPNCQLKLYYINNTLLLPSEY